jgi:predicted DCC family thiol-disulfide oxidoreductase YuxK
MEPGDRPEGPVVLFDGVCNLCTGTVQFVVPRDADGTLRFAPLQSAVGESLLADCGLDPDQRDSLVLVEDGDCHTRSAAALRIASHLDGGWSLLRSLRIVPRPVRDAVYGLVARYRYDVFGRTDRCMVPSPDIRDRFLATYGTGDEGAVADETDGEDVGDGDSGVPDDVVDRSPGSPAD